MTNPTLMFDPKVSFRSLQDLSEALAIHDWAIYWSPLDAKWITVSPTNEHDTHNSFRQITAHPEIQKLMHWPERLREVSLHMTFDHGEHEWSWYLIPYQKKPLPKATDPADIHAERTAGTYHEIIEVARAWSNDNNYLVCAMHIDLNI